MFVIQKSDMNHVLELKRGLEVEVVRLPDETDWLGNKCLFDH